MPVLKVERGESKGKTIKLSASTSIVVGRDPNVDFHVSDLMLSRSHFKIEVRKDGTFVVDNKSLNGTYLNNKVVKEAKLKEGDSIRAGTTMFSFYEKEQTEDPLLGIQVGNYKIIDLLGRGGMGKVYRAEQTSLNRIVALKVITDEQVQDKHLVDMFLNEARVAAKFNHPNLVQIYEVGSENEIHYFSMEYVPNGTVLDLLRSQAERRLPWAVVLNIAIHMARALEYAHGKNVVHGDIKPENMLIGEENSIKLADLGIASIVGERVKDEKGMVMGTPHYIAPEVLKGKRDLRSDLYSLGASLYLMLTGKTTHQAESLNDLIKKKLSAPPASVETVVKEIPKNFAAIINELLEPDPEKRTQSSKELLNQLEAIKEETKKKKAPVLAYAGLLALGVALIGMGAYIAFSGGDKKEDKPPVVTDNGGQPDNGSKPDTETLRKQELMYAKNWQLQEMKKGDVSSMKKAIENYEKIVKNYPDTDEAKEAADHVKMLNQQIVDIDVSSRFQLFRDRIIAAFFSSDSDDLRKAIDELKGIKDKTSDEKTKNAIKEVIERGNLGLDYLDKFAKTVDDLKKEVEQAQTAKSYSGIDNKISEAKASIGRAITAMNIQGSKQKMLGQIEALEQAVSEQCKRDFAHDAEEARKVVSQVEMSASPAEDAAQPAITVVIELSQRYSTSWTSKDLRDLDQRTQKAAAKCAEVKRKKEEEELAKKTLADQQRLLEVSRNIWTMEKDFRFAEARDFIEAQKPFELEATNMLFKEKAEMVKGAQLFVERAVADINSQISQRKQVFYKGMKASFSGKVLELKHEAKQGSLKKESYSLEVKPSDGPSYETFISRSMMPLDSIIGLFNYFKPQTIAEFDGKLAFLIEMGAYDAFEDYLSEESVKSFPQQLPVKYRAYSAGGSPESPELEAEKLFARVKELSDQKKTDPATKIIKLLITRLKGTDFFEKNSKEIDEIKQKLSGEGGNLNKVNDDLAVVDGFRKAVELEKQEIKKDYERVLQGDKYAEKAFVYFAVGDARNSFQYSKSIASALRTERNPEGGRAALIQIDMLLMLCAGTADPDAVNEYHKQGIKDVTLVAGKNEEYADQLRNYLDQQKEVCQNIRASRNKLAAMKKQFETNPSAASAYELVSFLRYQAYDISEARACCAALMKTFPTSDEAKGGNVEYLYAEIYAWFDKGKARNLLMDLKRKIETRQVQNPNLKSLLDQVNARINEWK